MLKGKEKLDSDKDGSKQVNFLKMVRKRMDFMRFYFSQSIRFSTRAYVLSIVFFQLPYLLLPSIQILCLYIVEDTDQQLNEEVFERSVFKLNPFYLIAESSSFSVITDVLNGIIFATCAYMLLVFFRFDMKIKDFINNYSFTFFLQSIILLIFGTFLFQYIFTIQLMGIKCYFTDQHCYGYTDVGRLMVDILGCIISFFILYQKEDMLIFFFPNEEIIYSRPYNKIQQIRLLIVFIVSFILVFEDLLLDYIQYSIILLPFLFFSIVQIVYSIQYKRSFSLIIDYSMLVIDTIALIFLLYAFLISLLSYTVEISFSILILLNAIFLTFLLILIKQINQYKIFKKTSFKNENESLLAITAIIQCINVNGENEQHELTQFLLNHQSNCLDQTCICNDTMKNIYDEQGNFIDYTERENYLRDQHFVKQQSILVMFKMIFTKMDSILLKFYEIFIKSHSLNNHYISFYELIKLNPRCTSNFFKKLYQQIKFHILKEIKQFENQSKFEMYPIDVILESEKLISEYRLLLFSISIEVERFWTKLYKNETQFEELLKIGISIVDQYLVIKDIYEKVIEMRSDLKLIVLLTLHLNQQVMNFELEGSQCYTQLQNQIQKAKIEQINTYQSRKDKLSLCVIQKKSKYLNIIKFCNKKFCQLLGYSIKFLIDREVKQLLPQFLEVCHNEMIEEYLNNNKSEFLNTTIERVWIKHKNHTIVGASLITQSCVSDIRGFFFVIYLDQNIDIIFDQCIFNLAKSNLLISNDLGYIMECNYLFVQNYLSMNQEGVQNIEEIKLNLFELFPEIDNFTQQELEIGVETFINTKFQQQEKKKMKQQIVNIYLKKKKYVIKKNTYYEIIFKEIDDVKLNKQSKKESENKELLDQNQQKSDAQQKQQEKYGSTEDYVSDYMQNFSFSVSSSTQSSMQNDILSSKGAIDFSQMPQSLQNLRKSIIFFFLILIATSFSVLAVSIISYQQFMDDSNIVKLSIYMSSYIASVRLGLQNLILQSTEDKEFIEFYKNQIDIYHDLLSYTQKTLLENQDINAGDYNKLINDNLVRLREIQNDGTIKVTNTSYSIAMKQYLSRIQQFITVDEQIFFSLMANYRIRDFDQENQSYLQKSAYFLIINGNNDLRDYTYIIKQKLIQYSTDKESSYTNTVLIIIIVCIFITFIATAILIPVTFQLDSEQKDIIEKWTILSQECISNVLKNIQKFQTYLRNQNLEENLQNLELEENKEKDPDEISQMYDTQKAYQDNQFMQNSLDMSQQQLNQEQDQNQEENKEIQQTIGETKKKIKKKNKQDSDNKQASDLKIQEQKISENKEKQKKLNSFYVGKKCKKGLLINSFSLIIIGYYIGSYFITNNLFKSATENFFYIDVVNKRSPCLQDAFLSLYLSYSMNESVKFDFNTRNAFEYIQDECLSNEKEFQTYIKDPPKQLSDINEQLKALESNELCGIVFRDDDKLDRGCQTFNNQILKKGLRETISSLYHYFFQKWIIFDSVSPIDRTKELLNQLEQSDEIELYTQGIFYYLLPIFTHQITLVEDSLSDYIKNELIIFIIIFSIFQVFLLFSLVFALKFVMKNLKLLVFRTRILLKIIPIQELQKLRKLKILQKRQRRYAK